MAGDLLIDLRDQAGERSCLRVPHYEADVLRLCVVADDEPGQSFIDVLSGPATSWAKTFALHSSAGLADLEAKVGSIGNLDTLGSCEHCGRHVYPLEMHGEQREPRIPPDGFSTPAINLDRAVLLIVVEGRPVVSLPQCDGCIESVVDKAVDVFRSLSLERRRDRAQKATRDALKKGHS